MWDFYTPQIQILQVFEFSDEGYREAREIEDRLIKPVYNDDPLCLNEHWGGQYSLDILRKAGEKGGRTTYENGTGIFKMTTEEKREVGKKSGQQAYENKTGIHNFTPEQRIESSRKGGQSNRENGTGFFKLSSEELSENGKKGGKRGAKNTNSQKYQCTKTGFISTPGPLTVYQKARGIDTSNRIRIN